MNVRNKLNIVANPTIENPTYESKDNILYFPMDAKKLASFVLDYPYGDLRIESTSLITSEVIQAIRKNSHIILLKLGSSKDNYLLTREVFDILNASDSLFSIDTDLVSGKYSLEEMDMLACFNRPLIGKYKIVDFYTSASFTFYQELSEEEIRLLSEHVRNGSSIFLEYSVFDNIMHVIESLKGKNITFTIPMQPGLNPYYKKLQEYITNGEKIETFLKVDLERQLKAHALLDVMVKDIRESNLSVYEKYLAVIEIVTHFKPYQENEARKMDARSTEYVLFNDFIVCRGYVELMRDLLNNINIPSYPVEVSYKDSDQIRVYHARIVVRLDDDKYNIHGLYIADPTWDGDLTHHYFNHSSMTFYEAGFESTEFLDSHLSIFRVNSSSEFMSVLEKYPKAIDTFIEIIQNVDKPFYKYLKTGYDLDSTNLNLVRDVYNYIIKNTKQAISGDVKVAALTSLVEFIYPTLSIEDKKEILDEIIRDNKLREQYDFKKGRN